MEKKNVLLVGCSRQIGQQICKELAISKNFEIVAGFDTIFYAEIRCTYKTCVTVDELRCLHIDIIITTEEIDDEEVRNFASSENIPIVIINNANEIKSVERYLLAQVTNLK